jgi:hypothetical protein
LLIHGTTRFPLGCPKISEIEILRQPSHMEAQRDVSLLTDGRKRLVEEVGGDMVA